VRPVPGVARTVEMRVGYAANGHPTCRLQLQLHEGREGREARGSSDSTVTFSAPNRHGGPVSAAVAAVAAAAAAAATAGL
jgi:hypothetical protein